MFSFISSFFSFFSCSKSSLTDFGLLWGESPVCSCVLGISRKGFESNLSNSIIHTSLLLMNKGFDIDDEEDFEKRTGILIEYGNYNPYMSETEKKSVSKGIIVYPYGESGGLRYYVKKYSEFIEQNGDIGYIDLNIDEINQKTFAGFINNIAKAKGNKWIQKNYYLINNFNSKTFVLEALKEIKPYFHSGDVYPADKKLQNKKYKAKCEFIPQYMRNELMKYYRK